MKLNYRETSPHIEEHTTAPHCILSSEDPVITFSLSLSRCLQLVRPTQYSREVCLQIHVQQIQVHVTYLSIYFVLAEPRGEDGAETGPETGN